MPAFTVNLSATRVAQVVLGGAAVFGGYQLSSSIVRSAYRDDLLGDPTRIVEIDGTSMIYQTREAQGDSLTKVMLGAGAATAAVGGVLALGGMSGSPAMQMLKLGAGTALFAVGLGAIAGATSMSKQFQGSDFVPIR